MITLGIETSGQQGSVALLRDGELLGERDLCREGRRHARTLVPEIRALLDEAELMPSNVSTLAVSIGPGSFTGLRVGVVCAKTWAWATGASVVAVDTFLAIAHQADPPTKQLNVISDAQRGELFVGTFERRDAGIWQRCGEIKIVPLDAWIDGLDPEQIVTGPAVLKLQERLPDRCRLETSGRFLPTASSIAELGERAAKAGAVDDAWTLEPHYLRRSAAEEKADQQA